MKKLSLSQDDNLSFKISFLSLPLTQQRIDLYFSLPVDMGINPSTLNEEDYFHSSIKSHTTYFSDEVHLPLVRSRYVSQKKGGESDYRTNLNLYAYQFRIALDTDVKQTLKEKDCALFYQKAIDLAEQTQGLLKKLRRYTPPDQKLSSYFENVDNFLSWRSEQQFLTLLAKGPKSSEHSEQYELLVDFCRQENAYREQRKYNSALTLQDPNRITNKMRLLQRLSEYGVVFKRTVYDLNVNLKRLVRGGITAVIMAFVMSIVLNARVLYTEVTLMLIVFLGVIYGIREIFKEDLTRYLWRKIQKGRPKWRILFTNSLTKNKILLHSTWLEFINDKDLPESVDRIFQKRRQQNKQEAQLLHYRCDSKILVKEFMPGFEEVNSQVFFNLTPLVRFLKKGQGRLYSFDGKKISNEAVERRYQINLVVRQKSGEEEYVQRIKLTLNRSKIINIEVMEAKDSEQLSK